MSDDQGDKKQIDLPNQYGTGGFARARRPEDARVDELLKEVEAAGIDPDGDIDEADEVDLADDEDADAEPAAQDASAPAEPEPTKGYMIPKERLDEVIEQRRKAEQEAAYLRGQLDTLKAVAERGTPASAPATPAVDPVEAIKAQLREQAARYDDGELTAAEWTEAQIGLNEQLLDAQLAKRSPARQQAPDQEDLLLETETAKLYEEFPAVASISDQEARILEQLAYVEKARSGTQYPTRQNGSLTPAGLLALRQDVARLAQRQWGDSPAGAPTPGGQAPKAPKPPRSMFPPSPHDVGTRDGGAALDNIGGFSEKQILRMGTTELARLPKGVLDKINERYGNG
ncbi:MAG: hypothetical protein IPK75_18995 [Acidobacteria bacterium]|nr:hypothetical protein [Acidobacteriota bacterium]